MNAVSAKAQIPGIRPCFEMDANAMERIAEALASGHVSNNGPHVQTFERLLASYLRVDETVAVANGSDALLLALKGMELARGAAILPAYTYIATLNAVVHAGLAPVFCDIEADSYTLDPNALADLLKAHSDTRVILPVNAFGVPPRLDAISELAKAAGAKILYDNAHGFGTDENGSRVGLGVDAQTFSFHATKTLPCVEGGLIVSEDAALIARVKQLRNHGLAPSLGDTMPGYNSKLDEIRAIIGIESLNSFRETLARRRLYGERLVRRFERFEDVFRPQAIPEGVSTNFQNLGVCCLPALRVGLRNVLEMFRERGVGVRSYFDPPLYKFRGFESAGPLAVTETVWQTLVSFPIHSRMSEENLVQIEEAIADVASLLRSGI